MVSIGMCLGFGLVGFLFGAAVMLFICSKPEDPLP